MDRHLSEKDKKMLLNVLEEMEKMRRKYERKEEEKRWSEFELPLTLGASLARLTTTDLSEIRTNLGIKGVSGLRKQALIEALVQKIPAALPALLYQLDETRYGIIKKIAERGGKAFVPLESHQIDYFKDRGMIFPGTFKGKKTLFIPPEVLECFKKIDGVSYRGKIRRNTEWIKLTHGMLYYYGILDLDELEKLLKNYTESDFRLLDYISVLYESLSFYREIRLDLKGISHIRVWDGQRVKEEHLSRPDLSFYPFTKTQLLCAGEPGFVDRNRSYESFVHFIKRNYVISRDEADSLVEECVYAIQNGEGPFDLLTFLQSQLEIDEPGLIKGFMDHIVNLSNNTRQWCIKGYTPTELTPVNNRRSHPLSASKAKVVDFATRKKVGRNDPCPCGSGKKFKKCCGG